VSGQGGDYVFTVKDNQRNLKRETDRCLELLADDPRHQQHQTTGTGHGREETRHIRMIPAPDKMKKAWPGLQAIGTILRIRKNRKNRQRIPPNRLFHHQPEPPCCRYPRAKPTTLGH
jgi:hypothetical protein